MRFTIGLPTDHVDQAEEFVTGEAVMECASTAEAAGLRRVLRDRPSRARREVARRRRAPRARSVRRAVVRGRGHHPAARADAHPRAPLPQSAAHREVGVEPRRALGRARDPRGRARLPEAGVRGAGRRLRRAQRADRRGDRRDAPRLDRRRDRDRRPALPHPRHDDAAAARADSRTRRSGSAATAPPRSGARPSAARAGCRSRIPAGVSSARAHARALEPRRARPPRSGSCASTRPPIGRTEPIDICFSPFAEGAPATLDELHALEELGVTWAVLHMPRGHDPRRVDRRGAAPRRRR